MPLFLIGLLLLGGGVSYAADGTLPGDALYPVKINVNEALSQALTFRDASEAKLQADLADRRASEAEELAARGELSPEIRADLEARFRDHLAKLEGKVADLGDDVATAQIAADLDASVRARAGVIAALSGDASGETKSFAARLGDAAHGIGRLGDKAEARLAASSTPDVAAAASGKKGAAENKIDEATRFVESARATVSTSTAADADAELAAARALVAKGDVKLAAGEYAAAFSLYQQAADVAQAAKLIVQGAGDFNDHRDERQQKQKEDRDGGRATTTDSRGDDASEHGSVFDEVRKVEDDQQLEQEDARGQRGRTDGSRDGEDDRSEQFGADGLDD